MVCSNMPFEKGNQLAKNGPMRRDLTVELITQLNEILKSPDGVPRTKLHRVDSLRVPPPQMKVISKD
jgi:hypothetical protein